MDLRYDFSLVCVGFLSISRKIHHALHFRNAPCTDVLVYSLRLTPPDLPITFRSIWQVQCPVLLEFLATRPWSKPFVGVVRYPNLNPRDSKRKVSLPSVLSPFLNRQVKLIIAVALLLCQASQDQVNRRNPNSWSEAVFQGSILCNAHLISSIREPSPPEIVKQQNIKCLKWRRLNVIHFGASDYYLTLRPCVTLRFTELWYAARDVNFIQFFREISVFQSRACNLYNCHQHRVQDWDGFCTLTCFKFARLSVFSFCLKRWW